MLLSQMDINFGCDSKGKIAEPVDEENSPKSVTHSTIAVNDAPLGLIAQTHPVIFILICIRVLSKALDTCLENYP